MRTFDQIFPTKKEKNEAIDSLKRLKDNKDWQFLIEKIVKPEIKQIENEVLTGFNETRKDERLKIRRTDLIVLSQLPERVVEALSENKDFIQEFDPYIREEEL